jgi:hypothetical protein
MINLPPAVANAFVKDMRACFAEMNAIKRDEIASHQMHEVRQFQDPRERLVRIPDIKQMFEEMKDQA